MNLLPHYRKLIVRVSLLYLFMNVISISLFTYVITSNQASLISDITRYQAKDVMSILVQNLRKLPAAQAGTKHDGTLVFNEIDSTFHRLAPQYAIFRSDTIFRQSNPPPLLRPDHVQAAAKAVFLREFSGMDYYLQVDESNDALLFYIPLDEFGFPGLTSITEMRIHSITQRFKSMYQLIGFTVLALTLLHLLFAFVIFRMIIRPIIRLYEVTRKVASGDYSTTVIPEGDDEIGALAEGFNYMTSKIRETIEQLNEKVIIINKAKEKVEHMANVDELTQLHNRRFVFAQLERLISISQRYGNCLAIILMDVDFFKRVNDVHGHQAGDTVLREIAARLKLGCRDSDILARYGGEEIIMVLPETSLAQAVMVAQKLRQGIEAQPITLSPGNHVRVTISCGVSEFKAISEVYAGSPVSFEILLEHADSALYRAKESGRNRVAVMAIKG